jgi:hypothetical protein
VLILVSSESALSIKTGELVSDLRALAVAALERLYRPEDRLFAFRVRRRRCGDIVEGLSHRYTAIALIGLAGETEDVTAGILRGQTRQQLCDHLLAGVDDIHNLGDVALMFWAARALDHGDAPRALARLKALMPCAGRHPTVELAWVLTALVVPGHELADEELATRVAHRLLGAFREESGLFAHSPNGANRSSFRAHVSCFADMAYPVQALSHYGVAAACPEALNVARCCADRMCKLQGTHGQWWWHFDVRTGRLIERYPVYAVHQDAMAPMALFAAQEACGADYSRSIERGLRWLLEPPEINGSLIDQESELIWRKVGRREPGKLSRGLQAATSKVHAALRMPGLDRVFRPDRVDYESRPYHMGWLLYAWSGGRGSRFLN